MRGLDCSVGAHTTTTILASGENACAKSTFECRLPCLIGIARGGGSTRVNHLQAIGVHGGKRHRRWECIYVSGERG